MKHSYASDPMWLAGWWRRSCTGASGHTGADTTLNFPLNRLLVARLFLWDWA